MTGGEGHPDTVRQRIARRTPSILRKAARMALNYPYRLKMWLKFLNDVRAADARSRATLWISAVAAPITALYNLDCYRSPMVLGDLHVFVSGIGTFRVRKATDDVLHVMSSREPQVRSLLESELGYGGTFVDGGANIGFYSLLAAKLVGSSGSVVALEMMPDTAAILRCHVEANNASCVTVCERALSDVSGTVVRASVKLGLHGQASIMSAAQADRTIVAVETVTLDDVTSDLKRIDVLKLDLEGAEYLALRGASSVLARTTCVVFENNENDPRIVGLLEAAGFSVEPLGPCDYVARANRISRGGPAK